MSSLRTAALPLLALSMILSRCALARTVTIVITGTVASGTDVSGVFGKPGAQLSGRFTLIFTFDDSNGEQQRPDCRGGPPYSPRICSSNAPQSLRGTATLQIGDSIPFDFGVPVEHAHPAATRTTWTWPQSSYRMTLGVGDGSTMVAGSIGSANIMTPQTATAAPPTMGEAWDSPFSDAAASSAPGINFTIATAGAKAYGLLNGTTLCVGDSCGEEPVRVFFSIAYLNKEKTDPPLTTLHYQSFPDAAATWERETKKEYAFREGKDILIRAYVRSAKEFIDAWNNDIAPVGSQHGHVVVAGGVFTHASTPAVDVSIPAGLEFSELPHVKSQLTLDDFGVLWYHELTSIPVPSTLTPQMIASLTKLNWDKNNSRLSLFGCNTALIRRGSPNWSPADLFAKAQKVKTWGEYGFSYFSQSSTEFVRIPNAPSSSTNVYLGAYCRGNNLLLCVGIVPIEGKIPASLSLP